MDTFWFKFKILKFPHITYPERRMITESSRPQKKNSCKQLQNSIYEQKRGNCIYQEVIYSGKL